MKNLPEFIKKKMSLRLSSLRSSSVDIRENNNTSTAD